MKQEAAKEQDDFRASSAFFVLSCENKKGAPNGTPSLIA
jgi:hypothetical protein